VVVVGRRGDVEAVAEFDVRSAVSVGGAINILKSQAACTGQGRVKWNSLPWPANSVTVSLTLSDKY